MKIETAKILSEFIEKQIEPKQFEKWVYSYQYLETELGEEIYTELTAINFTDKSAPVKVEKLVDSIMNYGGLHKNEIINLLVQIENRQIGLIDGISKLYRWAELGYTFLGRIDLVGNFNEQGKFIIHLIDSSMDCDMQWNKLKTIDPNFLEDLHEMRNKIESSSIILTGEKENVEFIGKQYKYIED